MPNEARKTRYRYHEGRKTRYRYHVVFCDDQDLWWLSFLKRGYRHCFLLISFIAEDGLGLNLVTIEPLSSKVILGFDYIEDEVEDFLEESGVNYIKAREFSVPLSSAPIGFFTCVELIKRVLGIHNRWIFTPWQLYKFLLDKSAK